MNPDNLSKEELFKELVNIKKERDHLYDIFMVVLNKLNDFEDFTVEQKSDEKIFDALNYNYCLDNESKMKDIAHKFYQDCYKRNENGDFITYFNNIFFDIYKTMENYGIEYEDLVVECDDLYDENMDLKVEKDILLEKIRKIKNKIINL